MFVQYSSLAYLPHRWWWYHHYGTADHPFPVWRCSVFAWTMRFIREACWKLTVPLKSHRALALRSAGPSFCLGGKIGAGAEDCILFEGEFAELSSLACCTVQEGVGDDCAIVRFANEFDGEGGLRLGNGPVGEGNFWRIKEASAELMRERDSRRAIDDNVWLIKCEANAWAGCWVAMIIEFPLRTVCYYCEAWKMCKNKTMFMVLGRRHYYQWIKCKTRLSKTKSNKQETWEETEHRGPERRRRVHSQQRWAKGIGVSYREETISLLLLIKINYFYFYWQQKQVMHTSSYWDPETLNPNMGRPWTLLKTFRLPATIQTGQIRTFGRSGSGILFGQASGSCFWWPHHEVQHEITAKSLPEL